MISGRRSNLFNLVLTDELALRRSKGDTLFQLGNFRSDSEQRVYSMAKNILPSILISSNKSLFNLFESDIVVRVPCFNSNSRSDIEVDGIHHKQERKIRFCKLRDKYLKSRDIIISLE
jgi:hypothetical protein